MNNKELDRLMKDVCASYGYKEASGEFKKYSDLKVTWDRTGSTINFYVSDYLKDAPEDAIRELIINILEKNTNGNAHPYGSAFTEWVNSPMFLAHRETFLKRKGLHDVEGLEDEYMIAHTDEPLGFASALFKVVAVGSDEKTEDVLSKRLMEIADVRDRVFSKEE